MEAPPDPRLSDAFVKSFAETLDNAMFAVSSKPASYEVWLKEDQFPFKTCLRVGFKIYAMTHFRTQFQKKKHEAEIPTCVVYTYITHLTGYGDGRLIYFPNSVGQKGVDSLPFYVVLKIRPLTEDGKNISVDKGFAHTEEHTDYGDYGKHGICGALLLEQDEVYSIFLLNEKSKGKESHKEVLKQSSIEIWFNKNTPLESIRINGVCITAPRKRRRDDIGDEEVTTITTSRSKRRRLNTGESLSS
jgi:hypothetical protein